MLTSLALIFIVGITLGFIFEKIKVPRLVGMLLTGIVLGPYLLNLIDNSILEISADLRQLALIIILIKAGLSLNIADLKKVGRPAILMSFVPAVFEIIAVIIFAPMLLNITYTQAAIMGAVLGAVSPAVVVPKMVALMEDGYGTKKSIPQMILAGASLDDVFVIVLFTSFVGLEQGNGLSAWSFFQIPVSIVLGIALGLAVGFVLSFVFRKIHMRDSAKVVVLLGFSCLLVAAENWLKDIVPLSGLLAVMGMAIIIQLKRNEASKRLSRKFSHLWVAAEIVLFVLVGAAVDIRYALSSGVFSVVFVILIALLIRCVGVFCCLIKTPLNYKERVFCAISYLPKATVQAAIGSVPLALGLGCGQIVLTVAVVSIILTAPLGAFAMDLTYKKLLTKEDNE
ncbi:MAG: cation:proton antiporter [Christensenellaceae bacterium]